MEQIRQAIQQMIAASASELDELLRGCTLRTYKRKELLSQPGRVPHEIFFINRGIVRVTIDDQGGTEHTIHFALENQFIADYSSFMQQRPALYALQALEETEAVALPRTSFEWGYAHMQQGDRLGRLVAEYYFIYQDNRIKNLYSRSPKERYDAIAEVFPDIHNRAPQHMIASYLGITPVHLSRLKKAARQKGLTFVIVIWGAEGIVLWAAINNTMHMKLSKAAQHRLREKYGPWAVIMGASSGIGRELAELLTQAGLNLLIHSRQLDELEKIAAEWRGRWGIEVQAVAADLSEPAGAAQIIAAAEGLPVGLLIASAGFGTSGLFIRSQLEAETAMLQTNCAAVLTLSHHFSKAFAEQGRGGIILMSSIVAFQGVPNAAHYAATKAYIQSLAEALAIELKPFSVDVLAAAPGQVRSGFSQRADLKLEQALTPEQVGAPILQALGRRQTALPGGLTKLLVYSLRTLPRWAKVRIMQQVMGGMTKHQAG